MPHRRPRVRSGQNSDQASSLICFVTRLLRLLHPVGSAPAIDYDAHPRFLPPGSFLGLSRSSADLE